MDSHARAVVAPLVLGCVAVAAWALGAAADGRDRLFPGPGDVARALVALVQHPVVWSYAGQTALGALGGAALGTAVAVPLGIALHRSGTLNDAVSPYLGASQSVPAIALAPLLVLWVGYGLVPVVLLCALMVFFPIVIATVVSLRHVDAGLIDAARLDGATAWQRLWHVELPLAAPQLLSGVRNGVALAVTGAVVGEMVMGGRGLGTLLTVQRDSLDTAGMLATIALLCALASFAYLAVRGLERRALAHASLPTNEK